MLHGPAPAAHAPSATADRWRIPGAYLLRRAFAAPLQRRPVPCLPLQEINEYLQVDPMTGLADLAGAEGSVHRAVAELSAHGSRHFHGPAAVPGASSGVGTGAAGQASMDIELGLALPPLGLPVGRPSLGLAQPSLGRPSALLVSAGAGPGGSLRRVSMQRGMVRVDGTESLTAISGGCSCRPLALSWSVQRGGAHAVKVARRQEGQAAAAGTALAVSDCSSQNTLWECRLTSHCCLLPQAAA